MLPINIQETGTDLLTLLLPLALCCMMPALFRQPSQSAQVSSETDSWYVSYGIQETYNMVVKEVAIWREEAVIRKSESRFAFLSGISRTLSRKKPEIFAVDQEVQPRLFRVIDDQRGDISFELTEVEEGGTSVKSTYGSRARVLIQDLKTKMPISIPGVTISTTPQVCPSCSKEMMPDFVTCPYCNTKLR